MISAGDLTPARTACTIVTDTPHTEGTDMAHCSPIPARKLTPAELTPMVRRILAVWRTSSEENRADGLTWYPRAYDIAAELTPADPRIGAGILAALSPQNAWSKNVDGARQTVRTGTAEGTHTGCQTAKADTILQDGTDPLDALHGPKERAFYACIADPDNTDTVVVDRHAHDIAVGRPMGDGDRGLSSAKRYDNVRRAYVRAAQLAGVTPCVLQATTWLAWRDVHAPTVALSDANVYAQAA